MKLRLSILLSIIFLAIPALACSVLRARHPLNWHITLEIDPSVQDLQAATSMAVTTLENRLDAFGVSNFEVKQLGNGRLRINLPNVSDRERLKKLLSAQGNLELSHLISPPSPAPAKLYDTKEEALASMGGTIPPNRQILPVAKQHAMEATSGSETVQQWGVVAVPAIVKGSDLRSASALKNPGLDNYTIAFSLRPDGVAKFGEWTAANVNEYLAVIYNGEIKSTAYIRSQIFDQGEISGASTNNRLKTSH